jgi:hypothetical protein
MMSTRWHADVTNDPTRDFALCVDIYEDTRHRATVRRDRAGKLLLVWHPSTGDTPLEVPAEWLRDVLDRASRDLP